MCLWQEKKESEHDISSGYSDIRYDKPPTMQESPPLLRRADNLMDNGDHPSTSIRRKGLGHSFKWKLQNFKDHSKLLGRSKSTASSSSTAHGHRAHSKSLSDIDTTLTTPIHAHSTSEPTTTTKRPALNAPANLTESTSTSPAVGDIRVPLLLQQGTPMTKVSLKKHKKFVFRLDADLGQIVWKSKQHKIS